MIVDPDRGNRNEFCRRMVARGFTVDLQRAGAQQMTGEAYKGHFVMLRRLNTPYG